MSREVPEWRRVLMSHGFKPPAMANDSSAADSDEVVSGETLMGFGKHRGLKFSEVPTSYANWALGLTDPSGQMQEFVTYLKQQEADSSISSNIGGNSWANANRSVAWTASMLRRMLPSAGMMTILDAEEQKKQENLQLAETQEEEAQEAAQWALDEMFCSEYGFPHESYCDPGDAIDTCTCDEEQYESDQVHDEKEPDVSTDSPTYRSNTTVSATPAKSAKRRRRVLSPPTSSSWSKPSQNKRTRR
eukprot:CAMPEP_0167778472 /NCGR_PEP_ID=MMETSP0111_2-20121227/4272_1 /TAXON_ID=91324 /ORGANISM="Lotharella globosa, Strain CCCM811" /LENGTH=245 /DNA_ID=CAMNT_0007668779 /DNA_START=350 /DNA_END=1087 /DNA_ORIENTATION=-